MRRKSESDLLEHPLRPGIRGVGRSGPRGGRVPPGGGSALKMASAINDRHAFSMQMKTTSFPAMGVRPAASWP